MIDLKLLTVSQGAPSQIDMSSWTRFQIHLCCYQIWKLLSTQMSFTCSKLAKLRSKYPWRSKWYIWWDTYTSNATKLTCSSFQWFMSIKLLRSCRDSKKSSELSAHSIFIRQLKFPVFNISYRRFVKSSRTCVLFPKDLRAL